MNPERIVKLISSFIPEGWSTIIGGIIALLAGVGMLAHTVGEWIGFDPQPDVAAPTWQAAIAVIGAAWMALGFRRRMRINDESRNDGPFTGEK